MGKGYESQVLFQVTFPLERLKLPKQCHQQGTSIQIPDSICAIFHSKKHLGHFVFPPRTVWNISHNTEIFTKQQTNRKKNLLCCCTQINVVFNLLLHCYWRWKQRIWDTLKNQQVFLFILRQGLLYPRLACVCVEKDNLELLRILGF